MQAWQLGLLSWGPVGTIKTGVVHPAQLPSSCSSNRTHLVKIGVETHTPATCGEELDLLAQMASRMKRGASCTWQLQHCHVPGVAPCILPCHATSRHAQATASQDLPSTAVPTWGGRLGYSGGSRMSKTNAPLAYGVSPGAKMTACGTAHSLGRRARPAGRGGWRIQRPPPEAARAASSQPQSNASGPRSGATRAAAQSRAGLPAARPFDRRPWPAAHPTPRQEAAGRAASQSPW